MKWVETKNCKAVAISQIPLLSFDEFIEANLSSASSGLRPLSLIPLKTGKGWMIYSVMADDSSQSIRINSASAGSSLSYESMTAVCPSFHVFERILHEETGIEPLGHPWLKPLRRLNGPAVNYPFYSMKDSQLHEVAVGPIHAGVIEPGHFRFICSGEEVLHLEIMLGYQHRGIEELILSARPHARNIIAESISGDSVIGHACAWSQLVESLADVSLPREVHSIRSIALEMERAGIHLGDLSAVAGDIAYLQGAGVYGARRTLVINSLLSFTGSRFGRGLVRPGGVRFGISNRIAANIKTLFPEIKETIEKMSETMFNSSTVLSRLDNTGVLTRQQAASIGMVGPAARASGLSIDVRSSHPWGAYRYNPIHPHTMPTGDVFARAYIRYVEFIQSIDYVMRELDMVRGYPVPECLPAEHLMPDALSVSLVEGWRGEIVHCAVTGPAGELIKYSVKDPSVNNWYGLALAVRGNGISDFPLINKSFNLSYSGNDL